jgi:thiol-disulfide isomerase/thioredoxin
LTAVTLAARGLLAAVLLLAGEAKARDRDGATEAAAALGVPRAWAPVVATILPLLEVGIAVLLVPSATAAVASALALALIVAFTATVAVALARGRRPACRCFGELSDAPIGAWTLLRNALLAGLALVALVGQLTEPVPDPVTWAVHQRGAALLALILAVLLTTAVVVGALSAIQLMSAYGRLLRRVERLEQLDGGQAGAHADAPERGRFGLAPGSPAPAFEAPTLVGLPVSLDTLLAPGRRLLLTFVSPNCGPCVELLPTIKSWQRDHADSLSVAFIVRAHADAARSLAAEQDIAPVIVDSDGDVAAAYQAHGTPAAVLVAPDGTIAEWGAPGQDAIGQLISSSLVMPPARVGDPLPDLAGVSLDDAHVPLRDLIEDTTMLLFWNPSCGYCRRMKDDVRRLELEPEPSAPRLVIVSVDADATRQENFDTSVLLDDTGDIARAVGAHGTPMAVLVGADGRIVSDVVAGANSVLALGCSETTRLEVAQVGKRG